MRETLNEEMLATRFSDYQMYISNLTRSRQGLLNLLQQLETKLFNLAKRVREVIDSANESTLRN